MSVAGAEVAGGAPMEGCCGIVQAAIETFFPWFSYLVTIVSRAATVDA
jgi:hypothetical protein